MALERARGREREWWTRRGSVLLPGRGPGPLRAITQRLLLAAAILLGVVALVYWDREGYRDASEQPVGLLDAFYYATVSLSTTGYGDITPLTDRARLVNVLLITPARVMFLIILVGTTLEVLTERSREQFRLLRWRSRVHDHVVICGYGTKGRSAVDALVADGVELSQIVVVEPDAAAVREATARGLAVVQGSSTRTAVLQEARVGKASSVIVAANRDDTAVLTVLTVRQLAPHARVVAAVRESENAPLLQQSGADQVVVSSATAGRLLGLSTIAPPVVSVIEDLLTSDEGMMIGVRPCAPSEVGQRADDVEHPVLGVVRDGQLLRRGHPMAEVLQHGDRLVYVGIVPD